jgi:hypothetical protein
MTGFETTAAEIRTGRSIKAQNITAVDETKITIRRCAPPPDKFFRARLTMISASNSQ